jgi:flagellar basal-body rod protein FlgB
MFEDLGIIRMAEALASHAGVRLGLIARNVAQADTPGYKAMDMPDFATSYQEAEPSGMRATRTGHMASSGQMMTAVAQPSGGEMAPDGNTVSLEHEMVKSVDVRQQHDMALAIYRNSADIIRASLGRR